MNSTAGPGYLGFVRKVDRIFNTGINVLSMTEMGQVDQLPLSGVDVENDLFKYDFVSRTLQVKYSGIKDIKLFSNANEGAATADIVYVLEASSSILGTYTPVGTGVMKEYSVDGGSQEISTTLDLDEKLFYRITLLNNDGGDVVFTTDTYTINGNAVVSPAFLLIMST